MGKAGRKKKRDSGVLRAEDKVPPRDKKTSRKRGSRKTKAGVKKTSTSLKKRKQPSKNVKAPVANKKARSPKAKTAKASNARAQVSEIPKFDLAGKIMAEQRKITSARRKAPGSKAEARDKQREAESTAPIAARPMPGLSERDQVIAEIVAGDIEKLCRGDASSI